jgi:hypothetical protein
MILALQFKGNENLSGELLRSLVQYDGVTGSMIWQERPCHLFTNQAQMKRWNRNYAGKNAAHVHPDGYAHTKIGNYYYGTHRLVWLYTHGLFPDGEIDHINGDRADNRIDNLRDVSKSTNHRNKQRPFHNKTGVIGVKLTKRGVYMAEIFDGERKVFLGSFKDLRDAQIARLAAERVLGYHRNHGRPA